MNTNRTAPRLFSLALAATITWSIIAGIDALAQSGHTTNSLMAQATLQTAQPL